ncbi:MAG TPA: hypothetical protein VN088_08530 [Nocardioides sp.]|nr:hypothetical protein [Nocardioides sp.]
MSGNLTFDGNIKVAFVTTIADINAPTVAELTAGDELQDDLTPDGLDTSGDTAAVDESSLGSTFSTEAAGRRSFTPSLTFKRYDSTGAATTPETTLDYRAKGYLVVRRSKLASAAFAAADKVDVYPVECGQPIPSTPAPNEVQKATVRMFMTGDPALAATVAA